MDNKTTQSGTDEGAAFFFGERSKGLNLVEPTKDILSSIKFRGQRPDLEVYHLAYGTKKLRACTYRRMKKRQQRKNLTKA